MNEKADLVIINGKVLTNNPETPYSEAIAIKGETIIAVGTSKQISRYAGADNTSYNFV